MFDTNAAGKVTAAYEYTLRPDGKRRDINESHWFDANSDGIQTTDELKSTSYDWTYDNLGRLTDEVTDHCDDNVYQIASLELCSPHHISVDAVLILWNQRSLSFSLRSDVLTAQLNLTT